MPTIHYLDHHCQREADESVLDALLRNGVPIAHSCKSGSCGACMLRAVEGEIPASAQAPLKDSYRAQGFFLSCICRPAADLTAAPVDESALTHAVISELDPLSHDVLRLRLRPDAAFSFRAGQYVTMRLDSGLARSYSLASLPTDSHLEMHVRLIPDGQMSSWLRTHAQPGATVRLLGPSGDCFYVPGREDQPLLLAGTGTGLAPLYGILRDALRNHHRGPIHLFHGALNPTGLYLRTELLQLAQAHPNFYYTPAVLAASEDCHGVTVGAIDRVILGHYPKLDGFRAFVCGDPTLVQSLKKKFFLSGIAMRDIHADAFLPSI